MILRNRLRPLTAVLLAMAVTVAGCASYTGLEPKQAPRATTELATGQAIGSGEGAWPTQQWWRDFGDTQLDQLIDEALAGSPQLDVATARLRAASAAAWVADAYGDPAYSVNFDSQYRRITENGILPPPYGGDEDTDNSLTLDFNYHLDFWGRNKATLDAALSREQVARAEQAEAALVLTTAVANSYIELAHLYTLLDIAGQNLEQRQTIYDLTQQRVTAGLDTRVQLKQAESELPIIRGEIVALNEALNHTRYTLAALLGAGPDRGLDINRPRLTPAALAEPVFPEALPAELLGRRPDIVASRWRVKAADSEVDGAKAEFYPNVNLAAFAGFSSLGLNDLLTSRSRIWGAGPAITLPIFASKTLRGQLSGRLAEYDIAVADYNRALIDALKEVAITIDAQHWLVERKVQQQAALETAEEALKLAMDRYRVGLGNYLTVLQAQTAVLSRQREGAALDVRALTLRIDLIKALGGGFDENADIATNADTQGVKNDYRS